MAQGAVKSKSKPAAPSKKLAAKPKRFATRVIKPKKVSLITQHQIMKKSTAGLSGATERMLAQKAGHLEMLKGGKRDKDKKAGEKGDGKGK